MGLVTLRNINPLGQVDLPLAYRQGEPLDVEGEGCLEPGEEFEVTDEQAGWPPSGAPGEDGYDPGDCLLAQLGNYEHVAGELLKPTPPAKPARKTAAAKKTAASSSERAGK